MAASISTSTLSPLTYASFSKPPNSISISPKTLTLISPPNPNLNLLSPSLSLSSPLLPINNTTPHSFTCLLSSQPHPTPSQDDEEDSEEEVMISEKTEESVDTLIRYFKEAVLAGDHQTVAEIETALYRLEAENNELVEKLSTLSEEIQSGKERYIRLQADFDNFRKRSEKERLSVRSNAQGEVIESLLPMVDNFERAKQQIKPESDREKQIDTSYQGIYKQFVEIMRSLQVAAVATVGKPFDPTLHEAIAREECKEFKEGIVIEEFRRGFLLGDRLLRPAMVKVSSGPGTHKDTAASQKSTEQTPVSPTSQEQAATSAAAAGVDEHLS